jgi:hypothetical protein
MKCLVRYRGTLQPEHKGTFDYSELCYLENEMLVAKGDFETALKQLEEQKAHMRGAYLVGFRGVSCVCVCWAVGGGWFSGWAKERAHVRRCAHSTYTRKHRKH